ncbi:MAG: 2-dehydropantoate 2-reductase [Myxococcales bacterium]|nr:2-dehydropantoate 2-reductase [Myxococcales bacterium]
MVAGSRYLVVGCGGIGGIVAAGLLHQGLDVTPLSKNELIADAINLAGIRTLGEQSLGTLHTTARSSLDDKAAPFDYVLLCTQPPAVEEATRQVLGHLADDGRVVVLQNGLCELRVAEIVGAARVIGGVVAWGASMVEPGVYDRTSSGGFTLGRLEGGRDERLEALATVLEGIGPVSISDNLLGARWSKLAINCAISALGTVGGERLGVLMRKRWVRRLALEIMSEAVEVARAEGVALEKVSGTLDLDWLALTPSERAAGLGSAGLVAKHALLLAVGTRYRRLRSSMLRAIERGRPPAVDFLNGEVVDRGAAHGIATPVNAALREAVWAIAKHEQKASLPTLRALYEQTMKRLATSTAPPVSVPPSAEPPSAEAPSPPTEEGPLEPPAEPAGDPQEPPPPSP